jgi:hypothetical protein
MIHGWCSRCWFTRSTFLLRQARAAAAWIFRCCKLFLIFAAADPIVISAAELVYLGDLAQNMLSHVPDWWCSRKLGIRMCEWKWRIIWAWIWQLLPVLASVAIWRWEIRDSDDLSSRGGIDDSKMHGGSTRKKLHLSMERSLLLEESFKDHSTLNQVRC